MNRYSLYSLGLRIVLLLTASVAAPLSKADDNLLAHDLFQQQRYAEAAEIFTDPAWKGVALYRSSQWWRAAEAFVRADDAVSFFNLGNAYVKLGYYALALEAYQAALSRQPEFPDAVFNAEVMRTILAQDKDEQGQAALQPEAVEIDRVDADDEESASASDTEEGDGDAEKKPQSSDREGDTDDRAATPESVAAGNSSAAGSDKTLNDQESEAGSSVQGTQSETDAQDKPSGGSEGKDTQADENSAGLRAELETQQATEQWLNQINSDTRKYLRAGIQLETRRRRAAGQAAPAGGSQW